MEEGTVEAKALNIYMLPGLAVSAMGGPDGLGLNVKQADISCLNGFD